MRTARWLHPLLTGAVLLALAAPAGARAPASSATPTVSGWPVVGSVITLRDAAWTGHPDAFAYEWYRVDRAGAVTRIAGADAPLYAPTATDVGAMLVGAVWARNGDGWSAEYAAAPIGPVLPFVAAAGAFSGSSAAVMVARSGRVLQTHGASIVVRSGLVVTSDGAYRLRLEAIAVMADRRLVVARMQRHGARASRVPLAFALDARGRELLAGAGRLTITVSVTVVGPSGARAHAQRWIELRA